MNKKHIVVFGLDNFGMSTIKQLSKYNCETLAIDKNLDRVEVANEYATYAMQLNMQDADDFEELSLNSYDIAIITFSDIQTSILAALVCKENGIPMVIAKANDEVCHNHNQQTTLSTSFRIRLNSSYQQIQVYY